MYKRKRVTAILLAGGTGARMGAEQNKVYLPLNGRPILQHAIERFGQHPYVDNIVLVIRAKEQRMITPLIQEMAKPFHIVIGGETRQESVRNGLRDVKSPIVLIHDGARPYVGMADITRCIEALDTHDGAVVAVPAGAPIYQKTRRKTVRLTEDLYAAQTPQAFWRKTLSACHRQFAAKPAATDDSALLEQAGYRVCVVPGSTRNRKMTTAFDLAF